MWRQDETTHSDRSTGKDVDGARKPPTTTGRSPTEHPPNPGGEQPDVDEAEQQEDGRRAQDPMAEEQIEHEAPRSPREVSDAEWPDLVPVPPQTQARAARCP